MKNYLFYCGLIGLMVFKISYAAQDNFLEHDFFEDEVFLKEETFSLPQCCALVKSVAFIHRPLLYLIFKNYLQEHHHRIVPHCCQHLTEESSSGNNAVHYAISRAVGRGNSTVAKIIINAVPVELFFKTNDALDTPFDYALEYPDSDILLALLKRTEGKIPAQFLEKVSQKKERYFRKTVELYELWKKENSGLEMSSTWQPCFLGEEEVVEEILNIEALAYAKKQIEIQSIKNELMS